MYFVDFILLTSRAATMATPKYCNALWELLPLKMNFYV